MTRWEFTPYNLDKWNKSNERILFVAAEPNGEQPNSGTLDMGEWFREAKNNNYFKNKRFFRRCEIILSGILGDKSADSLFDNFRFMDLKATSGGHQADQDDVVKYVKDNFDEVFKYFDSSDEDFGLSPHIIVLLGNTAQRVFVSEIRPVLIKKQNSEWVGMPHPSHTVSYKSLEIACENIRTKRLKNIKEKAFKWTYFKKKEPKDDDSDWDTMP